MHGYKIMALGLLLTSLGAAQTDRIWDQNSNAWLMYFGDHPVSERWGVHLEGQLRRHQTGLEAQQLLLRPAINYRLSKDVLVTGGYAFVQTYRAGDFPAPARFPEHRLFQQVLLRQGAGKVQLAHRYRLEQRFIGRTLPDAAGPLLQDWRYENRFRYMLRGTAPLAGRGRWYLAGYEEFFVNFGGAVASNTFDQNRLYGAVGRRMGPAGNLEWGYLNQMVQHRNGRVWESNHTLQLGWFSNLSFR